MNSSLLGSKPAADVLSPFSEQPLAQKAGDESTRMHFPSLGFDEGGSIGQTTSILNFREELVAKMSAPREAQSVCVHGERRERVKGRVG